MQQLSNNELEAWLSTRRPPSPERASLVAQFIRSLSGDQPLETPDDNSGQHHEQSNSRGTNDVPVIEKHSQSVDSLEHVS